MKTAHKRGLVLCIAMLSALALAAPAQATVTPVGATVSGHATNATLTTPSGTVTCPTAEFTGTVTGANNISGRLVFSRSASATCSAFGFVSATVTCVGTVTIAVTSSVAGTSASGTVTLDNGFECSIVLAGCSLTIRGPQGPLTGGTFDQARQILTADVRNIRADGSGGLCGGRGQTASFIARYAITPRITIS